MQISLSLSHKSFINHTVQLWFYHQCYFIMYLQIIFLTIYNATKLLYYFKPMKLKKFELFQLVTFHLLQCNLNKQDVVFCKRGFFSSYLSHEHKQCGYNCFQGKAKDFPLFLPQPSNEIETSQLATRTNSITKPLLYQLKSRETSVSFMRQYG